jgi:hypothetical protein
MDIGKIMQICIKNGLTVYPVLRNHEWFIQSNFNGKKKTFPTAVSANGKELDKAIESTWVYYYNNLFKDVDKNTKQIK